jgi:lytic murein transglycosylase
MQYGFFERLRNVLRALVPMVALLLLPFPARAADAGFTQFIALLWPEAQAAGVSRATFDAETRGLEPDYKLPDLILPGRPATGAPSQAEFVQVPADYLKEASIARLATEGQRLMQKHRTALEAIEARFGVPATIVLAIWGRETDYGRYTLPYDGLRVLATQAYVGRRKDQYRGEFILALKLLGDREVTRKDMRASWAGATGLTQFLPSEYYKHGVDFDGDGRRDIWSTNADIFASIANYLRGKGWVDGEDWGREVRTIPNASARIAKEVARRDGTCRAMRDMTVALPLTEWQRLGVRTIAGGPLPYTEQMASLVTGTRRKFLVYRNYDAILDYNCANSYALTVALLSEEIAAPEKPAPKPTPKAAPKAPAARRTTPPRQAH